MGRTPTTGQGAHVGTNPNLPVIKTARTPEAINEAVEQGYRVVVLAVQPNPEISETFFVFQHQQSGAVIVDKDVRGERPEGFAHSFNVLVYPYHFASPVAAYVVPKDLQVGAHVWLEDLIEDLVAIFGNQGYTPRLAAAEAIWKGHGFEILFDPQKDAPHWIG